MCCPECGTPIGGKPEAKKYAEARIASFAPRREWWESVRSWGWVIAVFFLVMLFAGLVIGFGWAAVGRFERIIYAPY